MGLRIVIAVRSPQRSVIIRDDLITKLMRPINRVSTAKTIDPRMKGGKREDRVISVYPMTEFLCSWKITPENTGWPMIIEREAVYVF